MSSRAQRGIRSLLTVHISPRSHITATASAADSVCRGSTRLPQSAAPELRRIIRTESAARQHDGGCGRRREIAADVPRLPQSPPRLPTQTAPQVAGEFCHTTPGLPANLHLLRGSRRPGVSRFLKQVRPDLLPWNDIGRVSLMPGNAEIELSPLRIRKRYGIRFQTLPHRIQQFCFFGRGQAVDLAS